MNRLTDEQTDMMYKLMENNDTYCSFATVRNTHSVSII